MLLAFSALVVSLLILPPATTTGDRIEERCQAIVDALVERGVPGVSAALVLPDGGERTFTAGFADLEVRRRMKPSDRLLSGSVGKTYVTAAVHLLVQQGKLDLDRKVATWFEDDVAEWLDRIPNARIVTLRQLLRHQSGIPRYVFDKRFASDLCADADRKWKPAELLAYIHDTPPLFQPGEGFSYSDTNYIIAGMVIEKVTGRSFYELVRKELLELHGLKDTVPSDRRVIERMAQGYVVMGKVLGVPDRTLKEGVFVFSPQFEWCGGGWANTPLDLARWARILYGGTAFDGPYLETLIDGVEAPELGPGMRYGLGAMLSDTVAGSLVRHDGFMPGYLTSMGYFPGSGISAAIQLNTDDMRLSGRPLSQILVEMAQVARQELSGE